MKTAHALAILCVLSCLTACGGGGGANGGGGGSSPVLTITTGEVLPETVMGYTYSTTLTAVNGQGALHWSITSSPGYGPDGLTIDPQTGIISGTVNFNDLSVFSVSVTDSASSPQTAVKRFTIQSYAVLQGSMQSADVSEYVSINSIGTNVTGGDPPFTYSVMGGALPPGLRLDSVSGYVSGSPVATGSFQATVRIQDSFSPPQVTSTQLTIMVEPQSLQLQNSLPSLIFLNRPFSGKLIAAGGTPPYRFSLVPGGTLPPGFNAIDPSGLVSGTPTTIGSYFFGVNVSDSSVPPRTANNGVPINVVAPKGRNDRPATATALPGDGEYSASISPYVDPPNGNTVPGDNDYYKLTSLSGSIVNVQTNARQVNASNPLDTVIEIVDGNGVRFTTCRQPGDNSTNFNSGCMNDDISASPHVTDSALDFQVPGPVNTVTTFFVRVLDWRGDARPDMQYYLIVSGITFPLSIQATSLPATDRGSSYYQQLFSLNGTAPIAWTISTGSLPPGLNLSSAGTITGTTTADGSYSFTVQAMDSSKTPQVATAQESIQVAPPLQIASPATLPSACLNQPYIYTMQVSGGVPSYFWYASAYFPIPVGLTGTTGVFSGTPNMTGTFMTTVYVADSTQNTVHKDVSLTVNTCP